MQATRLVSDEGEGGGLQCGESKTDGRSFTWE